jgi:excisionase family DNA binding protein
VGDPRSDFHPAVLFTLRPVHRDALDEQKEKLPQVVAVQLGHHGVGVLVDLRQQFIAEFGDLRLGLLLVQRAQLALLLLDLLAELLELGDDDLQLAKLGIAGARFDDSLLGFMQPAQVLLDTITLPLQLGMKCGRLRVRRPDRCPPHWQPSLARAVAIFLLTDRDRSGYLALEMSVLSETPAGWVSALSGTLLTTGQAAKLCAVDPRTIGRWADAGLLRSHRTVGGRRRMLRSDLLDFMRHHGMPLFAHDSPRQPRIAVLVDDTHVVSALLRAIVRIVPGADCRSAHDGFLAGALLTSFRPELVFLGIVMPGLSGIEVCEHIRSTPELAGTAVVIVSGHLSDDLRTRLAAVGADRFVSKPFSPSDIESAVAEFVKPSTAAGTVNSTARSVTKVGT